MQRIDLAGVYREHACIVERTRYPTHEGCGLKHLAAAGELLVRHNLSALARVAGQHSMVPNQMPPRRWDDCAEPSDQIQRLKNDGVRAILAGLLEPISQPSARVLLKTFGGQWRRR